MPTFKSALSQARERTSRHAGAWFFAPLAVVFAPIIAHVFGLELTFLPFIGEGLLRTGLDAAICVVIAYIILLIWWFFWIVAGERARKHLNPYIIVACL